MCKRGGCGVLGLRRINTCRKVPFLMTTFCIAFYESYLSTMLPHDAHCTRSAVFFSNKSSTGMTNVQFYPFLTSILVENLCLGLLSFSGIYLVSGRSASQTQSSGTGIKRSSFCIRTVKVNKVKIICVNRIFIALGGGGGAGVQSVPCMKTSQLTH